MVGGRRLRLKSATLDGFGRSNGNDCVEVSTGGPGRVPGLRTCSNVEVLFCRLTGGAGDADSMPLICRRGSGIDRGALGISCCCSSMAACTEWHDAKP